MKIQPLSLCYAACVPPLRPPPLFITAVLELSCTALEVDVQQNAGWYSQDTADNLSEIIHYVNEKNMAAGLPQKESVCLLGDKMSNNIKPATVVSAFN